MSVWKGALGAALMLMAAAPADAAWRRAETANFILYGDMSEKQIAERARALEDFDALLRMLTGISAGPPANRLPVYFAPDNARMQIIRPVPSVVAGFYSATPDGIAAFVDRTTDRYRIFRNDTLFHEYVHHFMLQYFPAGYPKWYVEGFAEYLMTVDFRDGEVDIGRYNAERALWLLNQRDWLPFEHMMFGSDRKARPDDAMRLYAQSWLLVHYLMNDDARRAATPKYMTALAKGEDGRKAFAEIFGFPSSELDARLRAYAKAGIAYRRLVWQSRAEAKVATPKLAIGDYPLLQAAMRSAVPEKQQAALRGRVKRAVGKREDELSLRLLAQAEALYGDGAEADRLLDRLLAVRAEDAELLYLKGMRHLRAGRQDEAARKAEFARARTWFARAHKADGNHFPTLYRYAEALSVEPDYASVNTRNILMLAHSLAPQVAEIGLQAAQLLILRGEYQAAEQVLAPIAASTHHPKGSAAALALMENARGGQRPEELLGFDFAADE